MREPGGRPGPGRLDFGALAGSRVVGRMFRNPRRTRAGVSRPGPAGRSQGRRRSATRGRASRSWVCAAMSSQVQRWPAAGVQSFGAVHPRVCLNSRRVFEVETAQDDQLPDVGVKQASELLAARLPVPRPPPETTARWNRRVRELAPTVELP